MLRDPDKPDTSGEDDEKELGDNPDRPFYAAGKTFRQQQVNARARCAQFSRDAQPRKDVGGGFYWTWIEKPQS